LQAELTKARIRRKLGSIESLKAHVERGEDNVVNTSKALHPRWVRINTLKTSLEDQLDTTFSGYERVLNVHGVRCKDSKRLYIDQNIPNLVAVSPGIDLSKSEAYKSGSIIFQDKASCFPAYLLDPLAEDGDIIDTCSAPGNKTTHIAAILLAHSSEPDDCQQVIHAFEKNKGRAEILEKMVKLAGSQPWTKLYQGQDFLKTDPESPAYKAVGALLLDPSCSGSGIVGRDDMPKLHLPVLSQSTTKAPKKSKVPRKPNDSEAPKPSRGTKKRKREDEGEDLVMVDDDGVVTAVNTDDELKSRLAALSSFQLELLLHAFKFPAAFKITYSTCSIHFRENEFVVQKALVSNVAKQRGWRLLKREEQVRGMREWPVRGFQQAYGEDSPLAEACIRANEGDENGTMGFFLAGFVREPLVPTDQDLQFLRDERGHLVRDLLGFPVRLQPEKPHQDLEEKQESRKDSQVVDNRLDEGEWNGFSEDDEPVV
jgi:putative methyltransferase